MPHLLSDLRQAFRRMAKRPLLTGLAVLSLALGIGVNSAIFTLVNAVLLRDLPFAEPARVVDVYTTSSDGFAYSTSSVPDYLDFRQQSEALDGLVAARTYPLAFDDGAQTELVLGEMVSGNFFEVLGIRPAVGRAFGAAEDRIPGAAEVAVLGYDFWQRRFAGDPGIVGSSLRLNGRLFEIVGVAPEEFSGMTAALKIGVWVPLGAGDAIAERPFLDRRGSRSLFLKGRLQPSATPEQAEAELDLVATRLAEEFPDTNEERGATVVPSREVVINPGFDGYIQGGATFLMGVMVLVLLIACSNLANLFLAQTSTRGGEIALRLALGAGRGRIVRQLLTESFLIALAGGAAALLLAAWAGRLLAAFQPPIPIPLALDFAVDGRVFAFTLGLAVLTALACGLAPALQASKPDLALALKDQSASLGKTYRRFGARNLLVVAQVALSTILLIGAGLFVRSLMNAQSIDPGFTLRQGAAVTMMPGLGQQKSDEEMALFYEQVVERARALDGVRGAALAEGLPLGMSMQNRGVFFEGRDLPEGEDPPTIDLMAIGPGYFDTLGIPLTRGRDFTATDDAAAPRAVIVNETLARLYWPGEEPLGKRLRFDDGPEAPFHEVVGVARDGKYRTLGETPRPYLYTAYAQDGDSMLTLVVDAPAEVRALADVRRLLDELDPNLPIFESKTLSEHLEIMLFAPRMGAALLASMGLLGLLLASIGLYGVVAYSVSQRTREVGVRMALGAERRDVLRLILGEGMGLVAIGAVLGVGAALLATRVLEGILYGVRPSDPLTYAVVPAVLLAVALLAHVLPARRATGIDPLRALRYE